MDTHYLVSDSGDDQNMEDDVQLETLNKDPHEAATSETISTDSSNNKQVEFNSAMATEITGIHSTLSTL